MEGTKPLQVRLYSKAPIYQHGTPLSDTITVLTHFDNLFSKCISISEKKFAQGEQFIIKPSLNIEYIKRGSLSSLLTVDMPSAYALVAPLIQDNSWELFKNSFDFVQAYIGHITQKREQPQVVIKDSPGSVNIVNVSGGNMEIGSDVYKVGTTHIDDIGALARTVTGGKAFVDIKRMGDNNRVLDKRRIDSSNKQQLISQEREFETDTPEKIPCKIYSMNLRSGKGRLDVIDEENETHPVPFEIEDGDPNAYIDAMKAEHVIASARKRFKVNSLGEQKLAYLYLSSILPPTD